MADNESKEESTNVCEFDAGYQVISVDWDWRKSGSQRLAFTSFIEGSMDNKVDIVSLNEESSTLQNICSLTHGYPPTKVMWMPYFGSDKSDLLATSGDILRIWEVKHKKVQIKSSLQGQSPGSEHVAPLASFDWNVTDVNMIGTASVDSTCTIWDLEHGHPVAQVMAHDKEAFDMAFAAGVNVFASAGADGSVRLFDLRNLEHSTILYESDKYVPVLRVDWSLVEPNYLAAIMVDNPVVVILDIRLAPLLSTDRAGRPLCHGKQHGLVSDLLELHRHGIRRWQRVYMGPVLVPKADLKAVYAIRLSAPCQRSAVVVCRSFVRRHLP